MEQARRNMALVKPRLVLQLNRLLSTSIAEGTLPNYERRDKQRHVKLPTVALPAPLQVAVDKIFSGFVGHDCKIECTI